MALHVTCGAHTLWKYAKQTKIKWPIVRMNLVGIARSCLTILGGGLFLVPLVGAVTAAEDSCAAFCMRPLQHDSASCTKPML